MQRVRDTAESRKEAIRQVKLKKQQILDKTLSDAQLRRNQHLEVSLITIIGRFISDQCCCRQQDKLQKSISSKYKRLPTRIMFPNAYCCGDEKLSLKANYGMQSGEDLVHSYSKSARLVCHQARNILRNWKHIQLMSTTAVVLFKKSTRQPP